MGDLNFGIDPQVLDRIAHEVGDLIKRRVEVALVVGGGNMYRGQTLAHAGIGRITADHMGMLATVMNALALRDALERAGFPSRIMSAIPMSGIVDYYDRRKAIDHLGERRVVIFAAGTGNPLVTTDSAASLRAIEIEAEVLFKATDVEGVYDRDPACHQGAMRYKQLHFQEALEKQLGFMDFAALCQCRDHKMKVRVLNVKKAGALLRAVCGEDEGTLIDEVKPGEVGICYV